MSSSIYIIHENKEWIPPFDRAFKKAGITYKEMYLDAGFIGLDSLPPDGVFWSRLSASSHTRNHAFSKEFGRAVLAWLETNNRIVVNGSNVLELEVSKVLQNLALKKTGIKTPKTIACFGKDSLKANAKNMNLPFITKHNQGGKGLGVRKFESIAEFNAYVDSARFEESADSITLLQEFIETKAPFITRAEFIGGEFFYAVRVDTSDESFELCPAEACKIDSKAKQNLAAATCDISASHKFSLCLDITKDTPIIKILMRFLKENNIKIAGVEFFVTKSDEVVVYDINTNTNYNPTIESSLNSNAADAVVAYLNNLKKVK
ncbi:alpha-L-glutamate ligase [Helicobacter sp. 12S02232-10]|uniref:ATP-grasp domain-containing protein n=1 Tax=Helicobacter sp. 12S02232-10 TaxID=1476197 RepID=UPI000BA7B66C|nr:alpha-L-glutamate ligase [Helicobacter sp. 12S02232-10]PAF46606.1 alpha-L-glutamate ligase [Helicobacter sp. 12S02232-10]